MASGKSNTFFTTTFENTKLSAEPLNWREVYYTNCPLVSASNVDQELGWIREEYRKIGVKYGFLRSVRENDRYPHYIHNLDNLIRFGGLFPPIHVHADIRRTRLLGVTHAPNEGGCMMVRSRDNVYRMKGVFEVDVAEKAETVAETFLDLDNVHGLRLDRMVGLGPAFGEWISLRASNRSQPPESLTV